MHRTLFAWVLIGFASGILCRSLFIFSWYVLTFVVLVAVGAAAAWMIRRHFVYAVAALFLLGSVIGAGRVMLVPAALPEAYEPLLESKISFEGMVVSEPDIRETTQRVTIEVEEKGVKTKVLAVADLYPEVGYGERVQIEGTLILPESFETDTGRTFRYDRFLAKDGIFALVERASLKTLAPREGVAHVMGLLIEGKRAFQNGLARAIPEPGASLASGLITGGKQGLGSELLDMFVIAGLVHIVVLSGYNVMIVAEGVLRVLTFLPRRMGAIIAGVTIGLFVLAAGAGAASIRAGLMGGLALTARATGRTYAVVRALLIVAVIMLLFNPLLLAYDPGFQLSFIATLGLILLSPIVETKLMRIKSAFWRDLLAATLSAQIAVLPLLLYQTGLFSVVSLPANLLVLPVIPLAMALGAIAGGIAVIIPPLAPIVGLPAYIVLTYVIEATKFFAQLPLASISLPQFPFVVTILLYALLAYVIAKTPVPKTRVPLRSTL